MKQVQIFDATGGTGLVIGDNSASPSAGTAAVPRGFIIDLSPSFDAEVEIVPLCQSASVATFDRKNESSSISVTCDYQFTSESERDNFILGLQDRIKLLVHVRIAVDTTVWWLPAASSRPVSARPIGDVACVVNYNFRGKRMQQTQPANI
jgi:hypothetical protein